MRVLQGIFVTVLLAVVTVVAAGPFVLAIMGEEIPSELSRGVSAQLLSQLVATVVIIIALAFTALSFITTRTLDEQAKDMAEKALAEAKTQSQQDHEKTLVELQKAKDDAAAELDKRVAQTKKSDAVMTWLIAGFQAYRAFNRAWRAESFSKAYLDSDEARDFLQEALRYAREAYRLITEEPGADVGPESVQAVRSQLAYFLAALDRDCFMAIRLCHEMMQEGSLKSNEKETIAWVGLRCSPESRTQESIELMNAALADPPSQAWAAEMRQKYYNVFELRL